jgi:hypothetical protein
MFWGSIKFLDREDSFILGFYGMSNLLPEKDLSSGVFTWRPKMCIQDISSTIQQSNDQSYHKQQNKNLVHGLSVWVVIHVVGVSFVETWWHISLTARTVSHSSTKSLPVTDEKGFKHTVVSLHKNRWPTQSTSKYGISYGSVENKGLDPNINDTYICQYCQNVLFQK